VIERWKGGAPVVRSIVEKKASYRSYREELRTDFWHSCAYCTRTELEFPSFEIDHYAPSSCSDGAALKHDYANLMWACSHCNESKSDIWPPKEARDRGVRFYRPDEDDPREHFEANADRLESRSPTGAFTIEALALNGKSHRRLRRLRRQLAHVDDLLVAGIRVLEGLHPEQLRPGVRVAYETKRKRLGADAKTVRADVLKAIFKSDLVDANTADEAKERREYLATLQALYPGVWRGRHEK